MRNMRTVAAEVVTIVLRRFRMYLLLNLREEIRVYRVEELINLINLSLQIFYVGRNCVNVTFIECDSLVVVFECLSVCLECRVVLLNEFILNFGELFECLLEIFEVGICIVREIWAHLLVP